MTIITTGHTDRDTITALKEREKKLVQALKSALPSLFGSEPELHKRALLVLKGLGVTDV